MALDTSVNGFAKSASSFQLRDNHAFATDLLFNLNDVRAACASGLIAHGNLVTMLKSRIHLERTYAQELSKMTRFAHFDERESGTMQHAMASLRAQYLNTSVQHRQLATNLEEEVLNPIEKLYESNSRRAQSLTRRMNHAKKDVKIQEDAYRKDYSAFDKTFKEASASFAAAMDSGFSSTLLETRYHHSLSHIQEVDSPVKTNFASVIATRTQRASGAAALRSINNHKIVNWLLPSSEMHRKEDLANTTVKLMTAAESARRKCQQTWRDVEIHRIRMCRAFQLMLADYQAVAPTLENVDVQSDIYDFIQTTCTAKKRVELASLTVHDLCHDTVQSLLASPSSKFCRPLRKSCLEIRDIASKKVPFDDHGNQELLGEALNLLSTASCEEKSRSNLPEQYDVSSSQLFTKVSSNFPEDLATLCELSNDEVEEKRAVHNEPEVDCDDCTPSVSPSGSANLMIFVNENELEATD
ncbi:FCH domain [Plasmopara halstedii]|uniref:FCH domain n=1 Tax=Plasmopara halstedii TaxID=4781 RepID=A0A0P1A7W6_PLAHL|nr:FCH domain [Plasmopara halstedii]CEG36394.1 FCH domain [Plasmopara halstedii]|eukprot:XP_024572763.1 FCH domain [Plasmopara halstedii]